MIINENLHNPIPLHSDKSKWYKNLCTAEGAVHYYPILPLGKLPLFQVTSANYPDGINKSTNVRIRIIDNSGPQPRLITYTGNITGSLIETGDCLLNGMLYDSQGINQINFVLKIIKNILGLYTITTNYGDICNVVDGRYVIATFSRQQIESGISSAYSLYSNEDNRGFLAELGQIEDLTYPDSVTTQYTEIIRNLSNDAIIDTLSGSVTFFIVDRKYRTDNIKSYAVIDSNNISSVSVGSYYIELNIDSVTYYSEPFTWVDNIDNYLKLTYRCTRPIVTNDNFIAFHNSSNDDIPQELYIPVTVFAYPYHFEPTLNEIDGYRFTQKLVSYRRERTEFFCSSYFVEAIRVLWHCNKRFITAKPKPKKAIDFMDSPEISWDNDNHYCSVILTFSVDTIIQTNGYAESI